MIPIIDLHCDLLLYLAQDSKRRAENLEARCSISQLKAGGVRLQTLAVYTQTDPQSSHLASLQLQIFQNLPAQYPSHFKHFSGEMLNFDNGKDVYVIAAIENASGLCSEEEPLEICFSRLESFILKHPILYVSLTWNTENRFGGGNGSLTGLKRDGELLLDFLAAHGIAVDLSHTSDQLAYDIINYIDKKNHPLTPIASHSNFRKVQNHSRNLSEEFAKEIIRRKGIIGLNLVWKFVGNLRNQVEYAKRLDPHLEHLCLGADFFYENDLPHSKLSLPYYNPELADSSCYPTLLQMLQEALTEEEIRKISYSNAQRFIKSGVTC